jgi:hypothetical protein
MDNIGKRLQFKEGIPVTYLTKILVKREQWLKIAPHPQLTKVVTRFPDAFVYIRNNACSIDVQFRPDLRQLGTGELYVCFYIFYRLTKQL